MNESQKRYDQKCEFFIFRFRKDKDQKYIDFLQDQENRTDFIRRAIDKELNML